MHRIRLGNEEFEGENNAYLLTGDGPTTLIDTGVATDDVLAQLEAGLAEMGLVVDDLDVVILTHWHYDHAGLAGHIQSVSGATVHVHEADAPMVGGRSFVDLDGLHQDRLDAWGVPESQQDRIEENARKSAPLAGDPVDVDPVTDGDELRAGGETLRVIHVPGHAAGLIALAGLDGDEAYVGDAVLPVYTPNIGGADIRVDRPLDTYRDSLTRLESMGFDRFLPGHRDPIEDPAGRIQEILAHHDERTRRVIAVLEEHGPSTAWEVSAELFGELSGVHILHGPGEAFAHLDELEAQGVVERVDTAYRLLTGAASSDTE